MNTQNCHSYGRPTTQSESGGAWSARALLIHDGVTRDWKRRHQTAGLGSGVREREHWASVSCIPI